MGAEVLGFFSLFLVPLAAILGEIAWRYRARPLGTGFLGLGRARLARGLLAAIGVMVLFAIAVASLNYFEELAENRKYFLSYWDVVPGEALWYIGAFSFVQLYFLTLFGVPLYWLFYRLHFASLTGVVVIALLISLGWTRYSLTIANQWCIANLQECNVQNFTKFAVPALLTALAFSFGAGLPLVKGVGRRKE